MVFTDGQGGAIRTGQEQRPDARSDPRLDWWREARFGMFIHWGLYAIPAGIWKGQAIPGIGEWIQVLHVRLEGHRLRHRRCDAVRP